MFIVPVTRSLSRANGHARDLGVVFDRLFDETFDRVFGGARAESAPQARTPALDVVETETQYTVTVDLPGVAKEDVKVAIDGQRVSIEAQAAAAEKKDGERVVYSERPAVRYARSFALPVEIDQAASQARLEHGVLSLVLAKKLKPAAAQLTIN
jgi:HSP20 family protein